MKQRLSILMVTLVMAALCAPSAWSQATATVKGVAKDMQGQPLAGATVNYVNQDTGQKYDIKTNKKGEFFSLGIAPGKYKISLINNGQVLFFFNGVQVSLGNEENVTNFDLQKETADAKARGQSQMSPEQKAAQEKAQKENLTIKALNEKLAAATQAQQAGNFDQAIAVMKEATAMDPNRDVLWAKLGNVYGDAAKKTETTDRPAAAQLYAQSAESYQKSLALKPSGAVYNNLGQALAKSGKTDDAIKAYNQAAQVDPPNAAMYYFNLGATLTNTGKIDDAVQAFDKTIAADPNRAEAYYWKGVNLLGKATLKGDKMVAPEGTSEAFNKYLELQPTGPYAEPAKQMLASMGASVETSYGKKKAKK